jgi:hypothetical protein
MAGVSLDCILIGFAVAVLAVLNVLVARTMDGHLQAGFRTIAQGLAEIREELRVGRAEIREELRVGQADIRHEWRGAQADMRAELREALSAMATAVATTNQILDRLARGQQPGPAR